ncbi:ABC sugar transporter, ATP-binding component (plasmid) [Rhodococcus jostii RHA1]|uniref:ABC sugar transporter, ATP-binding component n=1 Tax=Rhodococcus jostii (strain RHA1) TaxID=101510 RepID=Q0RV64_RHOJR|nr:sugar ABC transporter ATP-binding protein [Rhodococcus jostii]ABH00822.1 ABC sugar transporter, ATP-binding component [Rhodococcus jostii RHA1]
MMKAAVRLVGMTKSFDGVTVLDGVEFDIAPGEVHGLIGENGSGKSTLVKVLGGVHAPDAGSVCELWGNPLEFPVDQPQRHGIAIIHQDLALCDAMTVAENIGISSGFDAKLLSPYSKSRESELIRKLSEEFDLQLDPDVEVGTLAPTERTVVAILRALRLLRKHQDGQVLVLDEPTAALPHSESERLLAIVRSLAAAGTAVLFIGHRLQEVLSVCDRISVLRSGKLVATVQASETTDSELVRMMLGYDIGAFYPDRHVPDRKVDVLQIRGLSGGTVEGLDLTVGRGEIVGVTGLAGMGQDEVPYLVNGHYKRESGTVTVDGVAVKSSVRFALAAGIALVPGNRQRDSVWGDGTAIENLTLPFLPRFRRGGVVRHRAEAEFSHGELVKFGVRPLRPAQHITRFSGGNQQKIVLARWLQVNPKVLLLHEPTQGIDAGAKKEIYKLIRDAAENGAAIVVFSTDIEEVANVCHRVIVMRHGRATMEIAEECLSEQQLIAASQGALDVLEQK